MSSVSQSLQGVSGRGPRRAHAGAHATARAIALILLALPMAVSCGDDQSGKVAPPRDVTPAAKGDGASPGTAPTTKTPAAGGNAEAPLAGDGTPRPGRAVTPLDLSLPDAPPLDSPAAWSILLGSFGTASDNPDIAELAIDYLGRLGDAAAVRKAAASFLAKGDDTGGYSDAALAGAALAALVKAGDATAAHELAALARAYADDGDAPESLLATLGSLPEPEGGAMRALLTTWATQTDDMWLAQSLAALAEARPRSGAEAATAAAVTAVSNEELTPAVHGAALALLLATGDPRASKVAETLAVSAGETASLFEVIDGLAVRGLTEAIPTVRMLVDAALKEDNAALEVRSAAQAFVTIRGIGGGTADDRTYLRSLLGKDDGDADADVRAALWALGEDSEASATALHLADAVGRVRNGLDESTAVDLLESLARRGGATKPPFAKIVAAAAATQIASDPKRADGTERALRVRLAAAYAFLAASQK